MSTFLVEKHPTNSAAVLVRCSHDGNALMGRYGPATLSRTLGGYVLPADRLEHFAAWATKAGALVVDERAVPGDRGGVRCPACDARPSAPCINRSSGWPLGHDHAERLEAGRIAAVDSPSLIPEGGPTDG